MAESEEELKSLLMKVKVESEKVGLKLNLFLQECVAPSFLHWLSHSTALSWLFLWAGGEVDYRG